LEIHSQELEKQREIMLPKEGIKVLVCSPCDCNHWGRLTACPPIHRGHGSKRTKRKMLVAGLEVLRKDIKLFVKGSHRLTRALQATILQE